MHSPLASRTLLLVPDSRQTALAAFAVAGLDQAAYSAYGHQSRAPAFRMGFNGQLREAPGWYLLGNGHRVYNPVLMRFHSADHFSPFGKGGINPYTYCVGDPINHSDPTGRFFEWLGTNPLHSLGLNVSLLLANIVGAIVAPPITLALWSTRVSILGATAGMVGSGMQMAGASSAGKAVSIIGTMTSFFGAILRVTVGVNKLLESPAVLKDRISKGMKNLAWGWGRKPATPAATPATARSVAGSVAPQPQVAATSVIPQNTGTAASGAGSVSGASTGSTVRYVPGSNSITPSMITPRSRGSIASLAGSQRGSTPRGSIPSVVRAPVEPYDVPGWLTYTQP